MRSAIRPSGYEPGLASTAQKGHSEPSEITTTAVVAMSSVTNTEETYKIEPLQGSANYRTWKFSMKMVLQARDLWEVVSGEEVKPDAEKLGQAKGHDKDQHEDGGHKHAKFVM